MEIYIDILSSEKELKQVEVYEFIIFCIYYGHLGHAKKTFWKKLSYIGGDIMKTLTF